MIIYKIQSPSNKVYIGQTKTSLNIRFKQHVSLWKRLSKNKNYRGNNVKLFHAFDKYDPVYWFISIIDFASSKDELDEKETYYIQLYDSYNNGYNCTKGGDGRKVDFLEEDHKENISISRKKYFETEEGLKWKEQLRNNFVGENNPMFGKTFKHSEETKQKMKDNSVGKNKGKEPWNKGIKCSDEQKEKQSLKMKENHKNGKYDDLKRSLNMKGKQQTEFQKQRVSETKGKIWIIIDPNGNEFEVFSLNKFCKENGLDSGNIQSKSGSKKYKAKRKED